MDMSHWSYTIDCNLLMSSLKFYLLLDLETIRDRTILPYTFETTSMNPSSKLPRPFHVIHLYTIHAGKTVILIVHRLNSSTKTIYPSLRGERKILHSLCPAGYP